MPLERSHIVEPLPVERDVLVELKERLFQARAALESGSRDVAQRHIERCQVLVGEPPPGQ